MAGPTNYVGWLAVLNQLAGTSGNGELTAANATWSAAPVTTATSNLGLLAALNYKADTTNLGLDAVCNKIAGTTNNSPVSALNRLAGNVGP